MSKPRLPQGARSSLEDRICALDDAVLAFVQAARTNARLPHPVAVRLEGLLEKSEALRLAALIGNDNVGLPACALPCASAVQHAWVDVRHAGRLPCRLVNTISRVASALRRLKRERREPMLD